MTTLANPSLGNGMDRGQIVRLEPLREVVEIIGQSFLDRPENRRLRRRLASGTLSAGGFYRQILVAAHRLAFLAEVDARGLRPPGPWLLVGGATPDLAGCRLSSDALVHALGRLHVPGPCRNDREPRASADAVIRRQKGRDLSPGRGEIHARGDRIGFDEWAGGYESLLDREPHVDVRTWRFTLSRAGESPVRVSSPSRKAGGCYYTPMELIDALLDSALRPVLGAAGRGPEPEAAILGLRVCDPACGTGRFLLAAARRMADRLARVRAARSGPRADAYRAALGAIIGRCMYGLDVDPGAVELCRMLLWLEGAGGGDGISDLKRLAKHVVVGNALLGGNGLLPDGAKGRSRARRPARGSAAGHAIGPGDVHAPSASFRPEGVVGGPEHGFDVIVGNPPYSAAMSGRERRELNHRYPVARRADNSAAEFLVRCAELADPDGRVGLVMPKSLTYSHAWEPLRAWLRAGLTHAVDAGKAWPDVRLEQALVTYRPPRHADGLETNGRKHRTAAGVPRPARGPAATAVQTGRTAGRSEAPSRGQPPPRLGRLVGRRVVWHRADAGRLIDFLGTIPTGLTEEDRRLAEGMIAASAGTLGGLCTTRRGGGVQRLTRADGDVPVLAGRDLMSFGRPVAVRFLPRAAAERCGHGRSHRQARLVFTDPPQAVFQNIVAHLTRPADHIQLIGTVATGRMACLDTVNLLTPADGRLSPFALAGLLMSDLVNWFVYVCVYNRAVRTMHFDGCFLRKVPVPGVERLSSLDEVCRELWRRPDGEAGWKELNRRVYRLYDVPRQAAGRISAGRKPRWLHHERA